RLRYFSVTAVVWIAALALVVVGGVWSYDARLSDAAKVIPLAPQLPPSRGTPAPQRRETNPSVSRQQSEMVALEKSPVTVSDPSRTALPPVFESIVDPSANEPGGPGGGGGSDRGVVGVISDGSDRNRPEPPQPEKKEPPPQPQTQPQIQVVRSGGVIQGTAIGRVYPVYPPLAR